MNRVSKKSAALLAAAIAAISLPTMAEAKTTSSHTFRIKARVPVACWVRPDRTVVAQAGSAGSVIEACNNPGGYTVTAQYRPLSAGENARMVYHDRAVDLSSSGQQVLRHSSIATIRSVSYQFENVQLEQPLILALTIQPL
ncbi:MAG: hypothetical protein ACRYFE_02290 [Janthinobacterium lividum]